MGNFKSTLSGTITGVDVGTNQPITKSLGNPQLDGAMGDLTTYLLLPTAAVEVVITLPVSPIYCVFIKNLHGSAEVTVKWTPQGGAEAIVGKIGPSGLIIMWNTATGANRGITSFKLTSDTNATPIEYYFGA